jgi:hypothetical protein
MVRKKILRFSAKDISLSKIVFENMKQKEEKNFDTVAFFRDVKERIAKISLRKFAKRKQD